MIGWPQAILLGYSLWWVLIHVARDGRMLEERYSAASAVIGFTIVQAILTWGGWYTPME